MVFNKFELDSISEPFIVLAKEVCNFQNSNCLGIAETIEQFKDLLTKPAKDESEISRTLFRLKLQDIFGRGFKLKKIAIDDAFPEYIYENKNKLRDWIIEDI